MLLKNAIQKIHVYAYDSTTGAAKTNDAANITAYVSLDGTANAIDDTNPAEVDATNMPGVYVFDLTAAETNCDSFALYAKSSTSNIRIEPIVGFTTAGTSTSLSANAVAIAANAITETAIADDAIAAAKVKADAVTKIQAGLATPTNITAGTITTVTNLTNLPAITANWLTAAGIQDGAITNAKVADDVDVNVKTIAAGAITAAAIAASALNGKGDWSTHSAASVITAMGTGTFLSAIPWNVAWDAEVESECTDAIAGLPAATKTAMEAAGGHLALILEDTNEVQAELADGGRTDRLIDGIAAKTTNLPASPAAVGSAMTVSDKTGFSLAATGLDAITATEPTGKPSTFPGWIMWLIQNFRKASKTPTEKKVETEAGVTITTQAITDDGAGTETLGPPS